MRIIAGTFKGRKLYGPQDKRLRPTTDKVKEAIFSMIAGELPGAIVVDLFAGTGSLGLEALSRGAARCYFSDSGKDSLSLIHQNVAHCKAEEQSIIFAGDYRRNIERIREKADVIFLDPPYKKGLLLECLEAISENGMLSEDGVIVCEHGAEEELPDVINPYEKWKEKKYGTIVVTIYS